MIRPNLDTALVMLLLPLLLAQLVFVRRKVIRMPEPDGSRTGTTGHGAPLRLLVIGDSSAVGVGVPQQTQALTPQLADELGKDFTVTWHLCGRNGATTADAPDLLGALNKTQFDLVYVIFGVNDAKHLRPEHHWRRDLLALIQLLRTEHGAPQIFFSGLPRLQDFPLIPNPMRAILALRANRFDRALKKIATQHHCHHLPLDTKLDRAGMAPDGFHPGAPIYRLWAKKAAPITERLPETDLARAPFGQTYLGDV